MKKNVKNHSEHVHSQFEGFLMKIMRNNKSAIVGMLRELEIKFFNTYKIRLPIDH